MHNLELLRGTEWTATPLGEFSSWPTEVRVLVETIMRSTFPMCLALGPSYTQVYNDGYNLIYGDKHPASFGAPAVESWPEIWPFLEPALVHVTTTHEPQEFTNYLLPLRRFKGELQECYFDFCYSPVVSADGSVLGILSIATETTLHAIAERRNALLNMTVEGGQEGPSPISAKLQELLAQNELDAKAAFISNNRGHTGQLEWRKALEPTDASSLLDFVVRHREGKSCGVIQLDGYFSRDGHAEHVAFVKFVSVGGRETKTLVLWPSELVTEESSLDLVLRLEPRLRSLSTQLATMSLLKEELGEKDFFYRFLFENSVDGVVYTATSNDGLDLETIIAANKPACDLLGYSQQEMVGMSREALFFARDETLEYAIAQRARESTFKGELTFKDKCGRPVEIEVTSILFSLNSGERRSISVLRNISEKLRVERDMAERTRLETIARMTGGVSHDFNNLLMVILSAAEHLDATLTNPADKEVVDDIITASSRAASLTSQLVAYARRQNLNPSRIDMNAAIREIKRLLAGSVPEGIRLHYSFCPKKQFCDVDVPGLTSALANLVRNASDAMQGRGRIDIKIRPLKVLEPESAWLPAGEYVGVSVTDNGIGVAAEIVERVFEPYFTTKQNRGGSGLGLSMVQGFARQSGGDVKLSRAEPNGTTLTLILPRAASDLRRKEIDAHNPNETFLGTGGPVLVVDDDPDVRRQIGRILNSLDSQVVEADSAETAIEMLAARPRLVITDLVMPGTRSGIDVIKAASQCEPPIPAILISGYTDNHLRESDRAVATHFLAKPFTRKNFIRTMRKVLNMN